MKRTFALTIALALASLGAVSAYAQTPAADQSTGQAQTEKKHKQHKQKKAKKQKEMPSSTAK